MKNSRDVTRSDVIRMLVIGTIASAVGIALGLWIDWFPTDASTQAGPIDFFYDVVMIISVIVFVFVTTLILFMVWKFRMRAGEEDLDGPPIHGNTRLEVIWTVIPSVVIAILCVYAVNVLGEIDEAQANQVRVTAYAQQFAWNFEYTAPSGKKFLNEELYISCAPTGSQVGEGAPCKGPQVAFDVKATDVIHDFWIPQMRMKTDAVPGITTHIKVNPSRLGTYTVVCAELCGIGHSIMRANVHVVPPARYAAWLAMAATKKS